MFLPVGDAPSPKGIPFVTCALLALNVAIPYLLVEGLQRRQVGRRHAPPRW